MKTEEELNGIKEEYENLSRKLSELSEDELLQITGGNGVDPSKIPYHEKLMPESTGLSTDPDIQLNDNYSVPQGNIEIDLNGHTLILPD